MLLSYRYLIMGGGTLQTRVYGSHKGMTNVSKRMGQSAKFSEVTLVKKRERGHDASLS